MGITTTIPTNLDFPNRGVLERDAFVLAQETAQDLLAGAYTTALNQYATEANQLEQNVTELESSTVASAALATSAANYKGEWVSTTNYLVGQSVSYNGGLYLAKTNNIDQIPSNNTYWLLNSLQLPINSIDELKTVSNIASVNVLGYYTKGDGGDGTFYWDSSSTETDNGGTIIQATGVTTGRWKRVFSGPVNVKWFGAKGDGITDDAVAIQKAIDYAIKQYDPTETTYKEQDVTFRGLQKTIYFPSGIYRIDTTINVSFRNDWTITGDGRNTVISWGMYGDELHGAVGGMMFNARCSSHSKIENLTLNGNHKANIFIYQAGNGTAAAGSKGNVTGLIFDNIHFWNQNKEIADDSNELATNSMLCLTSIDTTDTWYYSVDDSIISNCRFSPNWLNGGYAIAVSSSAISINDCQIFASNGILASNGASFFMNNIMGSMNSAPEGEIVHSFVRFKSGASCTNIVLNECYLEGADYYESGNNCKLLYSSGMVATNITNIVVDSCSIGALEQGEICISLTGTTYANINIDNSQVQGLEGNFSYIYAPLSSITINTSNISINGDSKYCPSLIALAYKTLEIVNKNPLGISYGKTSQPIIAEISSIINHNNFKYFSMQTALESLNDSDAVTIYVTKDTDISNTKIKGKIVVFLAGNTIDCNGLEVQQGGSITFIGGTINTSTYGFFNRGNTTINSCTITGSTIFNLGILTVLGDSTINTSGDCITLLEGGICKINIDTCYISATGTVINIASGECGDALLYSYSGTKPSTGLWDRGTRLIFPLPSVGSPAEYFATSNGVGSAANWAHLGLLTV